MIRSFADATTEKVFRGEIPKGFPAELAGQTRRVLARIAAAVRIDDLKVPPSHRLHLLKGDKKGRWSVSVNDQFRITFRFEEGDAHEVRFEDYH